MIKEERKLLQVGSWSKTGRRRIKDILNMYNTGKMKNTEGQHTSRGLIQAKCF